MTTLTLSPARGDATREALVSTAMTVFARDGFHAVSTREIAEAANVNQALIGYHFRSKEGLYLAVFEHIARQIGERLGPIADSIEAALASGPQGGGASRRRAAYLPLILRLTDAMAELLSQDRSEPWAQLILREQQAPTAAFSVLYDGFMKRVMEILTRLVERIRGPDDEDGARLMVATILGQVIVLRAARASIRRHLGWDRIGEAELARFQQQVRANVTAMLSTKE